MINSCQRLRHAIVIRIFRPKCEIEPGSLQICQDARRMSACAAIGSYRAQASAAVCNELKADGIIGCAIRRRLEDGAHQVVVQERRTQSELRLFQPEAAEKVPRRLSKSRKRQGMSGGNLRIRAMSVLDCPVDFGFK